jgi:hypothetical protein
MRMHAREPLGRTRARREAGWAEPSRAEVSDQKPNANKKTFFFFKNIL